MPKTKISYRTMIMTYITYTIMVLMGHLRDQFGKIFTPWNYRNFYVQDGIPPLYTTLESFFIRRLYTRICDCWNRPIEGIPGKEIKIYERVSRDNNRSFRLTGKKIPALNFGSYNYLGFANPDDANIEACLQAVDAYDLNSAYPVADELFCKSTQQSPDTSPPRSVLEKELAQFLHKEDCIVFSMGFGTNTWVLSALLEDSLVFSDVNNHASLVCGMKLTNAQVIIFEHNSMADLERKLRFYLPQGQPETHRAWRRIFVIVEGVFSMEGTIVRLPELVALKKRYGFFIYLDEAHSIGAVGETGRGVCEHLRVPFDDVDILMGTFSKSFSAAGGYIAGSRALVHMLRTRCDASLFSEQLCPVVCTQILLCLRRIQTEPERLARLRENTAYLRRKLRRLRFQTLGDPASPVVPILICTPGKLGVFSRLCLELGLAVVVVGYPATPILTSRVRLCVSAAHTKEDIDRALSIIDGVGTILGLKAL